MAYQGHAVDRPRQSQDTVRDSLELSGAGRQSHEDHTILDEHEEAERLLRGPQAAPGKLQRFFGAGAGEQHAGQERDRFRDEGVELMHDMDDGGDRSSDDSSEASLDVDREKLAKKHRSRSSRTSFCARFTGIHLVILVVFAALLYGAYRMSRKAARKPYVAKALSNGTALFQPTTLLISLDGFRADFLNRNITPHLNNLVRAGVSPEYMLPSFPSVTFPNHFTLVTGLYPESHSVVGNTFWDPNLQEEFYYTDPARSMHPRFWLADPIWTVAESAGMRTAIHMWPGSEAHIGAYEPTYVDKFNAREPLDSKVNRILGLLDLPGPESPRASEDAPRPQLIAAYVPNVDADGHKYGPNSTQIRQTIADVDKMIGDLMVGLDVRNLTSIVNVIVVSDHGMATTSTNRLIQLDDLVDMTQFEHTDGWPLYGLRPKPGVDLAPIHKHLKTQAALSNGSFEAYLRDVDMPARYHFSSNPRIAPLWIVPAAGWAVVKKAEFDVVQAQKANKVYAPRGLHGYDHEHPLMRAIFIARGPAFAHPPGSRMPVFQNIEVFGLVCDSLGLPAPPRNGTLRLPLGVDGVHKNVGAGKEEQDLPADDHNGPIIGAPKGDKPKGWDGLGELPKHGDTTPTVAVGDAAKEGDLMVSIQTAPNTKPDGPWPPIASVPLPTLPSLPSRPGGDVGIATAPAAAPSSTHGAGDGQDGAGNGGGEGEGEGEGKGSSGLDGVWKWFLDKVNEVKSWAAGKLKSHKGDGISDERPVINDGHALPQTGA